MIRTVRAHVALTYNHRKKMTNMALLSLPWKMTLRSTLPRQCFRQKMGQILSSWRACFVIILSKSVLSQIQTIPNMHPVREIGQIAKLMIFSFPCFKESHPHKTHYNIIMMPFHNSCQEPTSLLTLPFKQSKTTEVFKVSLHSKISISISLGLFHVATQLVAYVLMAFNQQICKRWPAMCKALG